MIRCRVNAFRRSYQCCRDPVFRLNRINVYKLEKRKYQQLIRQNKRESWTKFCTEAGNANPWNSVYKFLKKQTNKVTNPSLLANVNGETCKDFKEEIVLLAKTFFPDDDIATDSAMHTKIRLDNCDRADFGNDSLFTYGEVKAIIFDMNPKKAPGLDGVTADVLRHIFTLNPKIIIDLLNYCLSSGIFPVIWKHAICRAIPKPNIKITSTPKDFRPISLIPVLGKLLEILLINRINYYLFSNNLLNCNQFGFIPQCSTIDPLLKVKNFVTNVFETKSFGLLVSLDI